MAEDSTGSGLSILRRWLRPEPAGDASAQAEAASLRIEYDRIFAQMGRTEFERVLSQHHADATTAYAQEVLAEANQLRAELETMAAARTAAEALASQHYTHAEAHYAARCKAEAAAASLRAEAAAEATARHTAETALAASRAEAEAEAGARLAAQAEAAAAEARATRAANLIAALRAEVATLGAARNAAEKARNLAQEAAMSQHGELIRLRAETGIVPDGPPVLSPAPPPPPAPPIPFDEDWYLATYGDVKAAVAAEIFPSGRDHYLQHGRSEGRQPLPDPVPAGHG